MNETAINRKNSANKELSGSGEYQPKGSRITLIVLTVLASLACAVAIALTTLAHLGMLALIANPVILTLIANPVILPVIIGVSLLAAIIFGCCISGKTKDNLDPKTQVENVFSYTLNQDVIGDTSNFGVEENRVLTSYPKTSDYRNCENRPQQKAAISIIPTFAPVEFTDSTMTLEDSVSRVGVGIVEIAQKANPHFNIHSEDESFDCLYKLDLSDLELDF